MPFSITEKEYLNPGKFLNKLGYDDIDPTIFNKMFTKKMYNFFTCNNLQHQWKEVIRTGKSCKRPLFWQVINIPPYSSFTLHAHPNIEYGYVIKGALYEIRLQQSIDSNYCIQNPIAPDVSLFSQKDYIYKKIKENECIINDTGSIHLSYTKSEGCALYTLWSGVHANVPTEKYSKFLLNFNIQKYKTLHH